MPLLTKLLFLLSVAPFVYLLRPLLFEQKRKIGFYFFLLLHIILLTVAVLSVLNLPFAVLSDEISFLNASQTFDNSKTFSAESFISDNFLLINNAFDKQLIPKPDQTQGDSTFIAVTNRRKLSTLFDMLAKDSNNIDLVVCDIGFDDSTDYDTLVSKAMQRLYEQNKLLVSVAGKPSSNKLLRFADNISGDVKEETNDKLFTTHSLKRNKFYSLPYKVYAYLNKIDNTSCYCFNTILKEMYSNGETKWKMNTFLPQFLITNESLLNTEFKETNENNLNTASVDSIETNSILLRTLGNCISESGSEDFLLDMSQRRLQHKKNIILIGTFSGNEDLHKTAFNDLHGPVILLNLIYALDVNQNKISFHLILILLIFFTSISLLLIYRVCMKVYENTGTTQLKTFRWQNIPWIKWIDDQLHIIDKQAKKTFLTNLLWLMIEFILIEELHYFLLVLMTIILYYFLGVMINGVSIVVYLIAFETFAVYFGKSYVNSLIKNIKS